MNTLPEVLLALATSAAGWSVFGAAVAVIEAMEPARTGRWLSAAGWIVALVVGLSMAVQPTSYGVETAVLATSLAIVAWRDIHRLRRHAQEPSPFRAAVPIAVVGVLAGCMAVAPALGAELVGRTITLSDDQAAACHERGCVVMTEPAARRVVEMAEARGRAGCSRTL